MNNFWCTRETGGQSVEWNRKARMPLTWAMVPATLASWDRQGGGSKTRRKSLYPLNPLTELPWLPWGPMVRDRVGAAVGAPCYLQSAGEIQQLSKSRNNKTFIDCYRVSCPLRHRKIVGMGWEICRSGRVGTKLGRGYSWAWSPLVPCRFPLPDA